MFLVFGKLIRINNEFPFLLRWKNVLPGSHALHIRFIRNNPLIDRLLSGAYPVNVGFISYMSGTRAVIVSLLRSTHRS